MKILLAACGTRGDVQPALALSLALKAAGHDILLAGPAEHGDWISRYDCPFKEIGSNWREIVSRYPDGQDMKAQFGIAAFLRREARRQFDELPEIMDGFDLAISFSLMLALHSVAEYLGLPSYWVATTPQLLPSSRHPPLSVKKQDYPGWINRLAWSQAKTVTDLILKGIINGCRRKMGLGPIRDIVNYNCGKMVFVATDPDLGGVPDDVTIDHIQLGHFVLAQKGELGPEIESFLAAGPPPLYVGFGSMAGPGDKMTRIVVEAARAAGQRLIISSGWAELGGMEPADDLLEIKNAPHPQLFPKMKAVIHHGGSGTTATAARAGVPQIIVPHLLDQFYWAHQVHRRALGPKGMPHTKLSVGPLEKAIGMVVDQPEYRNNAVRLAGRLASVDGAREAVSFIENRHRRANVI